MDNELRTQVRLPRELAEWLKQRARDHLRSMNSEMVKILQAEQQKGKQQEVRHD